MTSNFWEFLWLIAISFFLLSYLLVLVRIVVDVFRDNSMGGFAKALWIIALLLVPLLTALVYIIARGQGMAQRQLADDQKLKSQADAYIREVAQTTPADQIARAKTLLREGAITEAEFAEIKAAALAH
jgi:cbb3-type cytochrome oxidase subunit 3